MSQKKKFVLNAIMFSKYGGNIPTKISAQTRDLHYNSEQPNRWHSSIPNVLKRIVQPVLNSEAHAEYSHASRMSALETGGSKSQEISPQIHETFLAKEIRWWLLAHKNDALAPTAHAFWRAAGIACLQGQGYQVKRWMPAVGTRRNGDLHICHAMLTVLGVPSRQLWGQFLTLVYLHTLISWCPANTMGIWVWFDFLDSSNPKVSKKEGWIRVRCI